MQPGGCFNGSSNSSDREDRAVRAFAKRLHDDLATEHVYLFGSHATGRAAPDSDYDLIVVATGLSLIHI